MMDAMAELSAEQGYDATKIADIVSRAGVARKTLYDNFDGKEDLFLTAFTTSNRELMMAVDAACAESDGIWQKRIEAGLGAILEFFAERPAVAKMCMVEALSATPEASARYDAAVEQFVEKLRLNSPGDLGLPGTIEETLVGGVAWILNQQIRRGRASQVVDLLPELSEFVLSPYHGVAQLGSQPGGESDSTVADSNT
jgi:AcrR family transcriptional regulator